MENYILRIYRRDQYHPDRVVGIVEDVENGESLSFRSLTELIQILSKQQPADNERKKLELV